MSSSTELLPGSVALIGSGPGDPELLTLRAYKLIQQADVVLYDNLVAPEILDFAPTSTEWIYVGKSKGNHTMLQDDLCQLLVDKAKSGLRVVRLKGGDPFIFGRGGEELKVLREQGVPVEIVPGITAALGAAASFGFPLTHRDYAQSCVFVTGHLQHHGIDLNWTSLAQPNQTLVVYMGVSGLDIISRELQSAGCPGTTPAALIYRATWPNQKIYPSTLEQLAATAKIHEIKPPTLLVIGTVLNLMASTATASES